MTDSTHSRQFYDNIARYYDAENETLTADLELYQVLAQEYGAPILEIGCGSGRVSLNLASAGFAVEGVDTSSQMLARGRLRVKGRADLRDLVTFYEGDALTYVYPRQYPLILIPYNTLMHMGTQKNQRALLTHLRKFAAPDGKLVIDLPSAGEQFAGIDDNSITLERSFTEPESGNLVMQQSVNSLDRAEQLQHITWIYDEIMPEGTVKRTVAPLLLRYIFPGEMDLLLEVSGWKRVERYGDYDQRPFEEGCERLIAVAEAS